MVRVPATNNPGVHLLTLTRRCASNVNSRLRPRSAAGRDRAVRWRNVSHWILHVDLDQFIAAVEVLRHPELRGLPVVVGGDGDPAKRRVVATASYQARRHGVHSGLPMRTAARRCPDAGFRPHDRDAYEAASDRGMTALPQTGHVTAGRG